MRITTSFIARAILEFMVVIAAYTRASAAVPEGTVLQSIPGNFSRLIGAAPGEQAIWVFNDDLQTFSKLALDGTVLRTIGPDVLNGLTCGAAAICTRKFTSATAAAFNGDLQLVIIKDGLLVETYGPDFPNDTRDWPSMTVITFTPQGHPAAVMPAKFGDTISIKYSDGHTATRYYMATLDLLYNPATDQSFAYFYTSSVPLDGTQNVPDTAQYYNLFQFGAGGGVWSDDPVVGDAYAYAPLCSTAKHFWRLISFDAQYASGTNFTLYDISLSNGNKTAHGSLDTTSGGLGTAHACTADSLIIGSLHTNQISVQRFGDDASTTTLLAGNTVGGIQLSTIDVIAAPSDTDTLFVGKATGGFVSTTYLLEAFGQGPASIIATEQDLGGAITWLSSAPAPGITILGLATTPKTVVALLRPRLMGTSNSFTVILSDRRRSMISIPVQDFLQSGTLRIGGNVVPFRLVGNNAVVELATMKPGTYNGAFVFNGNVAGTATVQFQLIVQMEPSRRPTVPRPQEQVFYFRIRPRIS